MKMKGVIKWYKKNKGYGYIIGNDDSTYFFEKCDCLNNEDDYKEGEKVLFIPNFGELEYASSVEKEISSNE